MTLQEKADRDRARAVTNGSGYKKTQVRDTGGAKRIRKALNRKGS